MTTTEMTVNEAAARLRVTPDTIYRRIESGDILAVKVFSVWRIQITEIERLLAPSMSAEVSEDEARADGASV